MDLALEIEIEAVVLGLEGICWPAQAIFGLYVLSTLDNWGDALAYALDTVGVDMQPIMYHSFRYCMFFMAFVCVSSHIVLKTVGGVLVEQVRTLTAATFLAELFCT